ncbi:MAG: hypothetical protein E7299_06275 [Lachnospiraceae bacterium]|nr:hypothetical protein [Lachnospiraceae bacterium]
MSIFRFGGKVMDIFIDKFAQRRNAQELIRANYMAEAEENERLTSKLHRYDEALQDMRKLSLQNIENAEKTRLLLDEGMRKIQELQIVPKEDGLVEEALKQQKDAMEALFAAQKDAMVDLLNEQQATIEGMMLAQKRAMEDLEKASEDFMHKESVKVYRNIQAVVEEELPKQAVEITDKVEQIIGGMKIGKGILPVCILTLLAALANIGVLIAHLWGYL